MATIEKVELACRRARFEDLEKIAAIESEVFSEPYLFLMLRQLWDLHGDGFMVAEDENEVVGYALLLERGKKSLLFTFAVAKRFQRRGYGRELLQTALREQQAMGTEVVYLTVRPDNDPASSLFEEAGFKHVEGRDEAEYFGPGEPRYVYECILNS